MRRGFKAWLRQLVRQLERGPINRDELILLLHDVRDRGLVDQVSDGDDGALLLLGF